MNKLETEEAPRVRKKSERDLAAGRQATIDFNKRLLRAQRKSNI
jgi:hypothetical protein